MGRLSEKKIEWETICRDLDMEKRNAKEVVSNIKDTMKKVGVDNLCTRDIRVIIDSYNYLNFTNKVNGLDGVQQLITKIPMQTSGGDIITFISRKGQDKFFISVCNNGDIALTDFADYALSPLYGLAYDIYSGVDQRIYTREDGHVVCLQDKIDSAIELINNAKDGNIYRRDIFICDSINCCFIPIDIINIGAISGGIRKNIPYIIGMLAYNGNIIHLIPYAIEVSLVNGGKQYLNEASLTSDDEISLRGCDHISMEIIKQMKSKSSFNGTIYSAIMKIMKVLIDRLYRDPSFEPEYLYENFMKTVKFSDDEQWKLHQENAPEVHTEWFKKN